MLAIVDAQRRPVGVIRERDVRTILFNPFGHALMQNPSIGGSLTTLIRPCGTADAGLDADALVLAYLDAGGDGLVLTAMASSIPWSMRPHSSGCPSSVGRR